ncbi:MAG: acyl carrier protein [Pseudomonadota bacterium]
MTRTVWTELVEELKETFDDDELDVSPVSTAADVEGWDSVSNIELIVALEARFGVSFRTGEMSGLKNLGELTTAIANKSGLPTGMP